MEKKNYVVALARQFGCGAREIGQLIARELNIAYYDKELLTAASQASGISTQFLEATDERAPQLFTNLWPSMAGYSGNSYYMGDGQEQVFTAGAQAIRQLAQQQSCLFVGRCADFLLRDTTTVISVFIHSSLDDRIRRIIARGDAPNEKAARELTLKKNKQRAEYYNFYTDRRWGDGATYDLCVNATHLGPEATAAFIVHYIRTRLAAL